MIDGRVNWRTARRMVGRALDLILPPQCLSCGAMVENLGTLCHGCWSRMAWIAAPVCACCGAPLEFDPGLGGTGEALMCGACLARPPVYQRARAVFRYDDASRALILGFKHADRTHAAPVYGAWLARIANEMGGDIDLIAPVPLHWTRLAWRRYNQSALLAAAAAKALRRPCVPDLLIRWRRTPRQGEFGPAQRERNVRGAFRVHRRHAPTIAGKRIALIDDVLTTGATVSACAATLLDGGASGVDVLTLARVVRPASPNIAQAA